MNVAIIHDKFDIIIAKRNDRRPSRIQNTENEKKGSNFVTANIIGKKRPIIVIFNWKEKKEREKKRKSPVATVYRSIIQYVLQIAFTIMKFIVSKIKFTVRQIFKSAI